VSKSHNRSSEVTKIRLAGFQVFDELVELPMGRLTFLYGPNSAGKSAVEDALKTFSMLMGRDEDFRQTGRTGYCKLKHIVRRIGDNPLKLAEHMTLSVTRDVVTPLKSTLREAINPADSGSPATSPVEFVKSAEVASSDSIENHAIDYIFTFPTTVKELSDDYDSEEEVGAVRLGQSVGIMIDGFQVLQVDFEKSASINLMHPLLKDLGWAEFFQEAAKKHPDVFETTSGSVKILSYVVADGGGNLDFSYFHFRGPKPNFHAAGILPSEAIEQAWEYVKSFSHIFKAVVSAVKLTKMSANRLVPASRSVPSPEQLIFYDDSDWVDRGDTSFPLKRTTDLDDLFFIRGQDRGDENYRTLANSLLSKALPESWSASYQTRKDMNNFEGDLSGRVNRMLADHLFIDRGFRLACDYRAVLTPAELKSRHHESADGDYPLLYRLFLVDSQGREFSFLDVGSGLGYVLPVLVAVCEEDNHMTINQMTIIQQPELHLHPALQSSLGDVFIEGAKLGKQIVVETHSEHILLRVLKRIRQTSRGDAIPDELKIAPEDVSILYFDPSLDGTTKVKHLRISPDGEFLDRWPRGFFAERDQELFDE
jgi:hypothetical protein